MMMMMSREHNKRIAALASASMGATKVMKQQQNSKTCQSSDISGADGNISKQNISCINPLELDLVLNMVFDHLDEKDWLKCRTVNKQWFNLMSTQLKNEQTKEAKCRIILDNSSIQEYYRLLISTGPSLLGSFLNVDVMIGGLHKYDQKSYDKALEILYMLIKIRGYSFVRSIDVNIRRAEINPRWEKVFWLIKILAPGLKILTIVDKTSRTELGNIRRFFRPVPPRGSRRVFPRLVSFNYSAIMKNDLILAQIVNAAPKLEKLLINIDAPDVRHLNSYSQRTRHIQTALQNITGHSNQLNNIKQLNIPLDQDVTYIELQKLKLPNLEKLELGIKRKPSEVAAQTLKFFLKNNCPRLKSIKFDFHSCYADYGANGLEFPHGSGIPELPAHLPELPLVTHLDISSEKTDMHKIHCRTGIKVDNFNSSCFPNLRTITIHAGTFLYFSRSLPQAPNQFNVQWYNNPAAINGLCFPRVSRLVFIIDTIVNSPVFGLPRPPVISFREMCNQIHLLLPNLKSVFIDNQIVPMKREVPNLKSMVKEFLEEVPNIESLEFSNYFQNWVNEFLDESLLVKTNLQSLRSLFIPKISTYYTNILMSRGASIGLLPLDQWTRSIFEGLVMEKAYTEFPPNELHPGELELQILMADIEISFSLRIGCRFPVGNENIELNFGLVDPIAVAFTLNSGIIRGLIGGGHLIDASTPRVNRILLFGIQQAVRSYPLNKVVSFKQPKLNIRKLACHLPQLKTIEIDKSLILDRVEPQWLDDLVLTFFKCIFPTLKINFM